MSAAQLDQLASQSVVLICLVVAGIYTARIMAGVVLAGLSRVPGALGTWSHEASVRITPRLLRGTLSSLLAVGAGVAPMSIATANPSAVRPGGTGTAGLSAASPHVDIPVLDRLSTVPQTDSPMPSAAPTTRSPAGQTPTTHAPANKAPATHAPANAKPLPPPRHVESCTPHVVRAGESLWSIAEKHLPASATDAQVAAAWPLWWKANRDVIGKDPNLIQPGQSLDRPAC